MCKEDEIKVSILCLCFNHGDLIKKALDGFVMQETNFKYEIIVHDDASTDCSVEILRQYEKEYPSLFNNIYQQKNQYSQGVDIIGALMKPYAKGKYIAICEGDDYWTDKNKLQRQVDFLDANEEYSLCVHKCTQLTLTDLAEEEIPCQDKEYDPSVEEIIMRGGGYFPTCSIMFRSSVDVKRGWGEGICGDYRIFLNCAMSGKVRYMSENYAVHTYLHPGSWSCMVQKNKEKYYVFRKKLIESLKLLDNDTGYVYSDTIDKKIKRIQFLIDLEYFEDHKKILSEQYRIIFKELSFRVKIAIIFKAYLPKVYYWLRKIVRHNGEANG